MVSPSLGAAEKSSSTALSALRTSPPQTDAIYPAVPGSMSAVTFSRALRMDTARSTAFSTSAAGTCLNSNTVLRLSTAL